MPGLSLQFSTVTAESLISHCPLQEPIAICQMYRILGPAMVAKLQGDFAFVLHDASSVGR